MDSDAGNEAQSVARLLTGEAVFLKHLDFIQAAITRQAGNSSLIRGWALTLATAFYGFAAQQNNSALALVAIVPTVAFYVLDGYYLRQERLFRCLYTAAIAPDSDVPVLSMNVAAFRNDDTVRWRAVLLSRPLLVLYGFIVAAGAVVMIATAV
jgi:hypothetical protein